MGYIPEGKEYQIESVSPFGDMSVAAGDTKEEALQDLQSWILLDFSVPRMFSSLLLSYQRHNLSSLLFFSTIFSPIINYIHNKDYFVFFFDF